MKRARRTLLLLSLAALAGIAASEVIYRSTPGRRLLARFCGVENQMSPVARNLRAASNNEPLTNDEIDHQLDMLRDQFGDEEVFARAIAFSGLSLGALREEVAEHLRARIWIEKQIAPQLGVVEEEARQVYEAHGARFLQPQRYRGSHLFLAAPNGSAPELTAAKLSAIQGLAVRMLASEPLAQLAAETSEDEASKLRGGDLGYFSASRVPPEFFAEVEKLHSGEISAPFRSHLGFHIVRLSDVRVLRKLSFEEVQPEIELSLGNEKRATAVRQLRERLGAQL